MASSIMESTPTSSSTKISMMTENDNKSPYENTSSNITIYYLEKSEVGGDNYNYNYGTSPKSFMSNQNIYRQDIFKKNKPPYCKRHSNFKAYNKNYYSNYHYKYNNLSHINGRQYRRCTEEEISYIVEDYFKPICKRKEFSFSSFLENEIYFKNINWGGDILNIHMDPLSERIFFFHQSIMQSQSHLNMKLYLRDMIYYSIRPIFSSANLYIIGSSLNGFGTNTSDLDLCLMLTGEELDQRRDVIAILNAVKIKLSEHEWIKDLQLIAAKVPILRITFNAPFSNITVDLNANNFITIKNTHLICAYSNFDWRVRPLVSIVKEWAKRKGINDSSNSTFTSYSLVLMCIHYLQCGLENPILPSIQEVFKNRYNEECNISNLNKEKYFEELKIEFWVYESKSTLSDLLLGFLKYYAEEFNFATEVISIRCGRKMTKAEIEENNSSPLLFECGYVCIEEPFTLKNTAYSIYDPVIFEAIKKCFIESYQLLKKTNDFDLFLNEKSFKEDLGDYTIIPHGGVIYNTPDLRKSLTTTI